jgi:hypothetical protein
MDVLARIFGGGLQAGTPGPADDFWYGSVSTMTAAGIRVDADGARKLSAWYRGRDILATVLAMLPFPVYERLPNDGGSEPATGIRSTTCCTMPRTTPGFVSMAPTGDVRPDRPRAFLQLDRAWRARLRRPARAIDPTLVTEKQVLTTLPNGAVMAGRYVFDVRDPKTGLTKTFTQDEVFHLRGADGKGILDYARSEPRHGARDRELRGADFRVGHDERRRHREPRPAQRRSVGKRMARRSSRRPASGTSRRCSSRGRRGSRTR